MTFHTVKLDALCIVSNPIKERVNILPTGYKYIAQTDTRIQITFPPGAVVKEESICLHVRITIINDTQLDVQGRL